MKFPRLSRRGVLSGAIAGGVVTAAGMGGFSATLPASGGGFRVLSDAEQRTVEAIADALFPEEVFGFSARDVGCTEEVDRLLVEHLLPLQARALRYVFRTLEYGPILARGRRFSELDRAERQEVLKVWADPDVQVRTMAWDTVKMLFAMAYFSRPHVQAAVGYQAACGGGVS